MVSNLRISLAELVIWAVFATVGLTWTAARVLDGLEWVRDWWIDRRDSRESGVPVSGFRRLREWTRDRVTPLLEDKSYEDELEPLPPERSWEQMTSHQLPAADYERGFTDGAVFVNKQWSTNPPNMIPTHLAPERERRPPAWEAEHRAAYEAMGFDYPSGLMERVRELTP